MSKKEKKVKKKKNVLNRVLLCIILVGLVFLTYYIYTNFFKKSGSVEAPKVVDEIKNFNYVVSENDTKLFKSTFNELKKVLSEKEVDKKAYAEAISKLFIIDFFTLGNKTSKNDIGGVQFVFSSYKPDFVDYARDGIYKQVSNSIGESKGNDLPIVSKVEITKTEEISPANVFSSIGFGEDAIGFEITINWEYESGSDFQKSSTLTIVTDNDKLSVAKMTEE